MLYVENDQRPTTGAQTLTHWLRSAKITHTHPRRDLKTINKNQYAKRNSARDTRIYIHTHQHKGPETDEIADDEETPADFPRELEDAAGGASGSGQKEVKVCVCFYVYMFVLC